jgi:DNA-binding MarR family transcriptional regulator
VARSTPASTQHAAAATLRYLILVGEGYRAAVSADAGIGTTDSRAVSWIAAHGPLGQSTLAADLELTSSAATNLVDRLENLGLVERVAVPGDRRRFNVALTRRGAALAKADLHPLTAALARIDPDQQAAVTRWLDSIAADLRTATLDGITLDGTVS